MQKSFPPFGWYVPAGHVVHVAARSAEKLPRLQGMQSSAESCPVEELHQQKSRIAAVAAAAADIMYVHMPRRQAAPTAE
jgi:uncharacterized protein YbjT (DUF2867 family)